MSKRKAGTLLEKHGFKDADMGSPAHDKICVWLDKNMDAVLASLFPDQKGTLKAVKCWEKPLMKRDNIVGFIDMFVTACWTHTVVDRWRLVDETVLDWAEESFKRSPECLEVHSFTSFDTCLVQDVKELYNGQYYAEVIPDKVRISSDERYLHAYYRIIDADVLEWCTEDCKICHPAGMQRLDNGLKGGIRTRQVETNHRVCTGGSVAGYVKDALKDLNTYARVKTGMPPSPSDIVKESTNTVSATVLFEVKSAIRSLGEILRELRFYKQHAERTQIVVVCDDDQFAPLIREQGFMFHKCPKWDVSRPISSFFSLE